MLSKISILFALLLIILLSGCSSFVESTRKSLLGDSSPRKVKKDVKWVSKAQYDGLMGKYKNLSVRYEDLKDSKIKSKAGFDQIDELSNAETIDVFGKNGITNKNSQSSPKVSIAAAPEKINKELNYYKKAVALYEIKKEDEALKMFQYLENSPTRQISVRAKKYIGDIYFKKNKFDLALQVYEGIIRKNSFSGIVIKALESAANCSTKLGLTDKKLKYESILRDFFEVKV